MTLTPTIMRDPPWARRFRRLAPMLVILGLALLAMVPGVVVHIGHQPDDAPSPPSMERHLAAERR
jgi:hypothetical protein